MGQAQYLIDTNSVIDYLGRKIPHTGMNFMHNVINSTPNISVITKIDVLGYDAPEKHYKLLTEFMNDSLVLDLTDNIVDKCIEVRKHFKIKLPDAIIAATALAHKLTLITRNTSDFKNIQDLKLICKLPQKSYQLKREKNTNFKN